MSLDLAGFSRRDAFDGGLAILLTALNYSLLAGPALSPSAAAWILSTAHSLPIAARRRAPRAAFAVSAVAGLAYLLLGYDMIGLGITVLVMVYSLAAEVPRKHALIGSIGVAAGFLVAAVADSKLQLSTVVVNLAALAVSWFLGDSARSRRLQADLELQMRSEQAVVEERLRIARELHDVVAHSMSVVTVQAGMARMVIDDDPEKAKRSLVAIERAGQQAMDEMRRLLQVLRDDHTSTRSGQLAPTPGLSDLDVLLDDAGAGGTPINLEIIGERRELAPGVELAAYRVVQEAITNIRKHAPGSPARIRVEFAEAELLISIGSDLVSDHAPDPAGHGLTGMRERVELYRGELVSGARPDGTFQVAARLPYPRSPV